MTRFHGSVPIATLGGSDRLRTSASLFALCALALALLAGCKDAATPEEAASGMRTAIEDVGKTVPSGGAVSGPEALQPGQRLQGTITLDVGGGARTYRVIATKLADDLGKQAAARLGSAQGKAALEKANARAGGKATVSTSDVQELADAFAGKTMYSAQVRSIDILERQQVSIEGEAADGSRVTLGFSLPIGGDEVLDASIEYRPDRKRAMEDFRARSRDGFVRVTLERLQRDEPRTWSVTGSFDATDLKPGALAKKLAGRSIVRAAGRFDVAELHVRAP